MNITTNDTLKMCTFNARGHAADRLMYIKKLMNACDVLLVQEHWYFEPDIHRLAVHLDDVLVFGVSGMQQNELLAGRPYGGCATIIKKNVVHRAEQLSTASRRLCACLCHISSDFKFLLFNVYMPGESRDRECNDFYDILLEMRNVIDKYSDVNHVIIGGDMNTDLGRVGSSYAEILLDFCAQNDLHLCLRNSLSNVDFTYMNDYTNVKSTIDHFMMSENIACELVEYACKHEGDNLSDHDPVFLSMHVSLSNNSSDDSHSNSSLFSQRPAWHRASSREKSAYKAALSEALSLVHFPREAIECKRIGCIEHNEDISRYHNQLIAACAIAADRTIPKVKKKCRKAGWGEHVTPYQQEAVFWNRLWVENGKPRTGWVYEIRNRTRREYKRVSRWVARNQEKLKANRMATALLDNRTRDFWSEVKKSRCTRPGLTDDVDGVKGVDPVCELFKTKYEELYNSVSFKQDEMDDLTNRIDDLVSTSCKTGNCYGNHNVVVDDVIRGVSKLKSGKSDSYEGLFSDHFKCASNDLYVHIALLLSSMLVHGRSPQDMLLSVLVPIPKNLKKSLYDSNNYRSIAISSVIGKIFDNIVLYRHREKLSSSDLQFGFKPGFSTTQCTFVLQEVISFYTERNSMISCVLLDASKAFDRVNFIKLFNMLADRGICPLVINLLISMYVCQRMLVRWQGVKSDSFTSTNGVKQGAVLSPILFCIYMDSLLYKLKHLGVGCYMGHVYTGALSYADDLTLIAPSMQAMRLMLKVCEDFARSFDVIFNSSKSISLVFNSQTPVLGDLLLNGEKIPRKLCATHLGNTIGSDSDKLNKRKAMSDLYIQSNLIKSRFNYCKYEEKVRLFNSFCLLCKLGTLSS